MTSHGKSAEDRLKALTFIKAKADTSNISEISLSSDSLILSEEMMTQHPNLTFFGSLHASTARRSIQKVKYFVLTNISKIKRIKNCV
jgi:hypothetical protein